MAIFKTKTKESSEVEFEFQPGHDLEEMIELFGAEVVFHHARATLIELARSQVRGMIAAGKSRSDIQEVMAAWRPTVPIRGMTEAQKARAAWDKLPPSVKEQALQEEIQRRRYAAE